MILSQIIVGNLKNFAYVIGDENSKHGVLIDPSYDLDRIVGTVRNDGLEISYILNTHSHWDHTAGNKEASQRTGAKIVAHTDAPTQKDIPVKDGDILEVGNLRIKVMHTPGHCPDSICFFVDESLFTGDTLFVGNCGRTDLPGGDPAELYDSFNQKILKLEDSVKIYPGHDYGSRLFSSLRYEKRHNYSLQPRSKEEFVRMMTAPLRA
ncbi:MAG: MBL fold metallo-hydrolase [Nitrososphaerales archaeon]